ncbi:class I SAM-dependent methyltransferase [Planococcus sp. ISL-110]|uniref:class I SAM-dependent methyltransferase n=1 Tax=Planococcus sp. ISL-110 TaxID=2819167 RepID=UPI001BE820C3|nr:class I SAM-dependent methyltransferase [Planococcus sp. ISL-110]MBT2570778.1 class I SAM-dependent methyltransferase [Planococcus sp. ISL-110]
MYHKRFDPGKADVLVSKERQTLLPVEKIMHYLALDEKDVVADLGAGNGYFTIPIAKRMIYPVYAVDIEPKMLSMLKQTAEKESIENIHYIQSDLENIALEDKAVDKVMAAFVIHEVPDMIKALSEARRILKSGGTFLLIEWEEVPTEIGPPLEDKISSQEMVKLLEKNGFRSEVIHLNNIHYAVVAKPY